MVAVVTFLCLTRNANKSMKVYDCFNFFNELDILEMRLNILDEVVDHFVIVESNLKHSGEPKPYFFEENKHQFARFLPKIISYHIEDNPVDFANLAKTNDPVLEQIHDYVKTQKNRFNVHTQPDYGRDFFQKESVRRALVGCNDEDIIMLSDADEIPNPDLIKQKESFDTNTIYSLNQKTYYYYINVLKQTDWYGTKIGTYKKLKNLSFNEVRGDEKISTKILNGGWHFSFMGGKDMVKTKLTSYSARDMLNPHVLNSIENNMVNNIDPFFRDRLNIVDIDSSYPAYILENLNLYRHMIK